ncbi:MAG: endopeptidase La [Oscillospiraceae bacterium]|nr:endopeptidase La [Oscillospiraceae bacterium]
MNQTEIAPNRMPMVAMRGVVIFPKMVMHFDVAREASIHAVNAAYAADHQLFLVAQREIFTEEPNEKDLYEFGVIAEVRQVLKTPDGVMRVLVEGVKKARLCAIQRQDTFLTAEVKPVPYKSRAKIDDAELSAMMRSLRKTFDQYCDFFPRMPRELVVSVLCQNDPYELFNNIIFNINLEYWQKQELLEENHILKRLEMLYAMLQREIEILNLEREIQEKTKESMDRSQREFYLREQMHIIEEQLGEAEDEQEDALEYITKIKNLKLESATEEKLVKEAERLGKLPPATQESFVIRNYLDTVLALPWNTETKAKINLEKARTVLDKDHYGMKKVKERVLESIAIHAMLPDVTGQILCLVGPPGVGKTSIGKSIAKALGRNYERVSLGGVRDESDIRGHRKTYVGAMPGRIIDAMTRAKSKNPLILLDEIDKMSNDFRGDPSAAMLEVLDSEQNKAFRDHYIEVPFDLSKTLFIATANTLDTIPAPLLDRMEVIELGSYNREEKFQIAKYYLLSKQMKKHGLKGTQFKIQDAVLYTLIDDYTREAGVRELERMIAALCRKAVKKIVAGDCKRVTVTMDNLATYLGHKKYLPDEQSQQDAIGIVNGLAWTSVGGVLMPLETLVLDGKGMIELTGSLGDVMKESAKIAVSYVRSIAKQYHIPEDFYLKNDLHIHAPEGAVPKDGPSAGVTMVTAIVSALSGIPVRHDVAMTGEITLHGKVLPIGGLPEKAMAAYKAGLKTVIIPKRNEPDLEDVDETVKNSIQFVTAETLETVLKTALVSVPELIQVKSEQSEIQEEQPPFLHSAADSISPESKTLIPV